MAEIPQKLRKDIENLMRKNRRTNGEFQYTVPSTPSYPFQWLWDSCFHAIILSHFDVPSAKKELLALTSRQFENGMIPHMIYWDSAVTGEEGNRFKIDWGEENVSTITQPPLLAYAAWKVYEKDQDQKFLERIYPALFHFYKYLLNERDPHEKHLIGIINPDESGEDNSPRFDHVLDLPPVHDIETNFKKRLILVEENKKCKFDAPFCMKNFFWVKDVPINAIMVENLRCLARIAEKIGRGYDAEYFNAESGRMAEAMQLLMREPEDGLFYSTYGEGYQKIKVKTWAIFAPLFSKLVTPEEADRLVADHLLNDEEFRTPYPIPSVALNEPSFNPSGFWRGPTWIAVNWFVYRGLLNYGHTDVAEKIKADSISLLEKSGFREQFHPFSAEGQGAENFTWGGLVLDMD